MAGAFYFYIPFIQEISSEKNFNWELLNNSLVLFGIGISFSSLQDPKKTQNKLSRIVWENPRFGRWFLVYMILLVVGFIGFGTYSLFTSSGDRAFTEVATGIIVLGIGLLGLLKVSIEMRENHRLDKKPKED